LTICAFRLGDGTGTDLYNKFLNVSPNKNPRPKTGSAELGISLGSHYLGTWFVGVTSLEEITIQSEKSSRGLVVAKNINLSPEHFIETLQGSNLSEAEQDKRIYSQPNQFTFTYDSRTNFGLEHAIAVSDKLNSLRGLVQVVGFVGFKGNMDDSYRKALELAGESP
jgi:hypothetical protein